MMQSFTSYRSDLSRRYWEYQKSQFPDWENYFEPPDLLDKRPPVFLKQEAWRNVLINPQASQADIDFLLSLIPIHSRHKWFRSMNSSQALAQSILGNLAMHGLLPCLNELKCDEGESLLGDAEASLDNFAMEFDVDYLAEPHPTNLDAYINGRYQVAIECKYTEREVGACSRPRLKPEASNYISQCCDGNYSRKGSSRERCLLTEIGVLYWRYIPALFKWPGDLDIFPCPLHKNYQLVRNLLAIGAKVDGKVSLEYGHVVLIYDDRNPAFQEGGQGYAAFHTTRQALLDPAMLRRCSWQRITNHIRQTSLLPWLDKGLALKYGL